MSKLSRRDFLESTLAVASAALAASPVIHAAEEPKRAYTRSISPNEKINVACIGLHSRGNDHLKAYLAMPDVNVVALCDVDQRVLDERVKQVTEKYGKAPKAYQDLRKLFEDGEVDAVSCAMP